MTRICEPPPAAALDDIAHIASIGATDWDTFLQLVVRHHAATTFGLVEREGHAVASAIGKLDGARRSSTYRSSRRP